MTSQSPVASSPNSPCDISRDSVNQLPMHYKLVFDNIDRTIRPRDMRTDAQNKSIHHVQMYAVRSRIDYLSLSKTPKLINSGGFHLFDILPSEADYIQLKKNLGILVSRILVDNVPFFKDFSALIPRHINHKFSDKLSLKSEVVGSM